MPSHLPIGTSALARLGCAASIVAFACTLACSQQPGSGGGTASRAMGMTPPPPPPPSGTPTLPAPTVTWLGELASSELLTPTRIAVGPSDEILVSDAMGHDVHVFTARGTPVARIAGFGRPLAIGAAASGQLYVGDAADGSVAIVARDGQRLGALGAGPAELSMPNELAVAATTGEVFVADSRSHTVRVFSAEGAPLRTLLKHGATAGQVSFPTGLLVDPEGRLVVVDHDNARVETFTADGALVPPVIGGTISSAPGGMMRPQGIARDALGRLYVADAYVGTVQVFDPGGAHLAFVGAAGKGPGQMTIPSDVVVDRFGRLLVASYDTGKVQIFGIDAWEQPPAVPADGVTP